MKRYLTILLILLILVGLGCRDKVIVPPDNTNKPGKRDYVWTVDTLAYPGSYQTLMRDIWASSAKDVYVVGHNDQNRGQMYHYDGQRWSAVHLAATDGGTIVGPFDLSAVYGFASNDVYAVGEKIYTNPNPPPNFLDSSLIIHFDGSNWTDLKIQRRELLICVAGYLPNKIWAGGHHGTIYYYDGTKFTIYELGKEFYVRSIACLSQTEVYATADRFDYILPVDSTGYFILKFNGSNWQIIDSVMKVSGAKPAHFGTRLWTDGKTLYSAGSNLYKYSGNSWVMLLEAPVAHISKTSDNNFFTVGKYIYHYNGIDWIMLTPFNQSLGGLSVFATGEEVFVLNWYLDSAPQTTIILHGK